MTVLSLLRFRPSAFLLVMGLLCSLHATPGESRSGDRASIGPALLGCPKVSADPPSPERSWKLVRSLYSAAASLGLRIEALDHVEASHTDADRRLRRDEYRVELVGTYAASKALVIQMLDRDASLTLRGLTYRRDTSTIRATIILSLWHCVQ